MDGYGSDQGWGDWYQYCYSNLLRCWDPLGTSGFKIFGCEVSDSGIKVDKVEFVLEAVKTALPQIFQKLYYNKTLFSEWELLSKRNDVPSGVVKFVGDALIGIGNGFKLWNPNITSLGLALAFLQERECLRQETGRAGARGKLIKDKE